MSQAERKWDKDELDLFEAGRAEMPPQGSADSVLAALGLEAPPTPGGGEPAPVSGPAPVKSSPPPASSGIFARPAAWIGAGVVALALVSVGLSLSGENDGALARRTDPLAPQQARAASAPEAKGQSAEAAQAKVPVAPDVPATLDSLPEEQEEKAAVKAGADEEIIGRVPEKIALKGLASAPEQQGETAKRPSLAEELAVIKKARAALNTGNLSGATAALAEHARRFTPPRLSTEARVIRVELLLKQGNKSGAKKLAAPLMKENSPYRKRMETLLSTQ